MIWLARQFTVDYTPEEARQLLDWLLAGIPEERRDQARRGFLEQVAEIHRRAGVELPIWVATLLEEGEPARD